MTTHTRGFGLAAVLLAAGCAVKAAEPAAEAAAILQTAGVQGGLIVHLGCGDGRLTVGLRANDRFLVHGLDADPARVAKARALVHGRGLGGKVSVSRWSGERLPFVDNLIRLLVVSDPGGVPAKEMLRVLAPDGVLCVRQDGAWERQVKPRPEAMDAWTHFLRDPSNNAVSRDRLVGPPRRMQWLAEPLWCRYHHTLASISSVVCTSQRVFSIVDEATAGWMEVPGRWRLVARDAFNGVLLWKRPIDSWAWHRRGFRSGPVQLPRTLVAGGGCVYLPLGLDRPVSALDAATGETAQVFQGTANAEELVLHDGVLLVVVGAPAAEQALIGPGGGGKKAFPNRKTIAAFRAGSGAELWRWAEPEGAHLMPLTLAAEGDRVFFQAGEAVLCRSLATGRRIWQHGNIQSAGPKPKKTRRGKASRRLGWSVATLVVHDGVVLWADGRRLTALTAGEGKELWHSRCRPTFHSPVDVLVIDDLVWLGQAFTEGRALRTGKVEQKTNLARTLWSDGHHHRCYRNKATDRYILTGKRGIEFFDLAGDTHSRNNWVRGVCQYGVLPANGLVYAPSHACGCYMEAKLYGFWALAPEGRFQGPGAGFQGRQDDRLERGPAFTSSPEPGTRNPEPDSRPIYRHDPLGSGSTPSAVPAKLAAAWTADVGGRLSAPVVADGLVVLSAGDAHRVVALGAGDGKMRWSFAAGGRVDSPPTLWRDRVLFGCAEGSVYCLRASDGAVAWRVRAAPEDRRTVALDRVESLWPVHGSVLVDEGVAYASAGRSSYLDGGIRLVGLDPATGKLLCQTRLDSEHPTASDPETIAKLKPVKIAQNTADGKTFTAPDRSDSFSMAGGATTDVLVSDGTSIYLRQVRFDRKLVRQKTYGRHLFSTSRLLDGAEVHRSHWVLGTADFSRIPVAYSWIANSLKPRWGVHLAEPYGLLLAFDAQTAWGVRRARGYLLFAEGNEPFSSDEKPLPDFRKPKKGSGPRFQWTAKLPLRPRALVRAGERLVLGGMPAGGRGREAYDAFEGRQGGVLWIASTGDGKKVASYALPAPPVWDGMAAAGGRLYVASTDGRVLCLAADGETPLKPHAAASASSADRPGRPFAPVRPDKDGRLVLQPETARTTGRLRYQPDRNNLGAWVNPQDTCSWNLQGLEAGTYAVDFAYGSTQDGAPFTIIAGKARLKGKTERTGGIKTYKSHRIGTIDLPSGKCTLTIQPGPFNGALMNFRRLTLSPVQ